MYHFSYLNLIKREAKIEEKAKGISHSQALRLLAERAGFANYHEMVTVAKCNPNDIRLMRQAIGVSELEDVLYQEDIWYALDLAVKGTLSYEIAETNASGFTIENMRVLSSAYDTSSGVLTLEVYFEYQGEHPDRPWPEGFYIDATVRAIFRGAWALVEQLSFMITGFETFADRDFRNEVEEMMDDQLEKEDAEKGEAKDQDDLEQS